MEGETTMASIRVTPETLETQGNELVGYSEELKEILDKVNSKIDEIIGEWDGLAQDAFYDMYTSMKSNLDQFPEVVYAIGNASISAAKAFDEVDQQLQGTFNSSL